MKKMKGLLLIVATLLIANAGKAQRSYFASAGEMIFSMGIVGTDYSELSPVVRFTPFFNMQEQLHYDFSSHAGIYTGLGIRNVGLISRYEDPLNGTVKIKERSYSLGIPLALKFGDMDGQGVSVDIGAEAEMMFAYKRKIIGVGDKMKYSDWFSSNVNLFNPSAYAEVKFEKGNYIRLKYYLRDFLNYQGVSGRNSFYIPDYGPQSPLFYVSYGMVRIKKSKHHEGSTAPTQSAYFREKNQKQTVASLSPLKD